MIVRSSPGGTRCQVLFTSSQSEPVQRPSKKKNSSAAVQTELGPGEQLGDAETRHDGSEFFLEGFYVEQASDHETWFG